MKTFKELETRYWTWVENWKKMPPKRDYSTPYCQTKYWFLHFYTERTVCGECNKLYTFEVVDKDPDYLPSCFECGHKVPTIFNPEEGKPGKGKMFKLVALEEYAVPNTFKWHTS